MDASPDWGFGILCPSLGAWCCARFTQEQLDYAFRRERHSSSVLELVTWALMLASFPVAQAHVHVVGDSENVSKWGFPARASRTDPKATALWRLVTAQQAVVDCSVSTENVPREDPRLVLMDLLSKGDIAAFRAGAARLGVRLQPAPLPVASAALARWRELCPIF
jgi:hypothetical protein